jgi:hypothetical protein
MVMEEVLQVFFKFGEIYWPCELDGSFRRK